MSKRIKNLLALLLAALMTLTLLPMTALAAGTEGREEPNGSFVYVNPFYRRTHTDEELAADLAALRKNSEPTRATPHYTTFSAATAYVRNQMLARNTSFTLSVPNSLYSPTDLALTKALVEEAMAHTAGGNPQAGDSLRWQIGYCYCSKETPTPDGSKVLTYTARYYTTAAQENTLTSEVNSAMASLSLSGKTETQKIRAIYDFICDRVNYDYEHVEDTSYEVQYTAYGAMHDKTAVCQGYAVLFYRMCMEAGLDVRVVTSVDHAWNIVRIGSLYYNVDATWDGGDDATTHDWYLKGMREFPDHFREPPFDTETFEKAYPMVADPDLNVDNLSFTFRDVDGVSVTSDATWGPKVLIFGCIGTDPYTKALMTGLAKYDLGRLDVVCVDCDGWDAKFVRDHANSYNCQSMTVCYNESKSVVTQCLSDLLNQCGDMQASVYFPVAFYIDANNKIRDYTTGFCSGWRAAEGVADHLGLTLSEPRINITEQPHTISAPIGDTALFKVQASGSGLQYQWQYKLPSGTSWLTCPMDGAKTASLPVPVVAYRNGYQYRCAITDAGGNKTYTRGVSLLVKSLITVQPADVTVPVGETALFKVEVSGGDMTYRWEYRIPGYNWRNCPMDGADTAALSVPAADFRNGYQYHCVITDSTGASVTSDVATLYILTRITSQPADKSAAVGDTAKFTVKATGAGLTYQWQYKAAGGTNWLSCSMEGNQTKTLSVPVTAARNGYQYRCRITDANGSKTYSNAAKLTVKTTITAQPADKSAPIGGTAKFTVKATGAGLTYQWQYYTGSKWTNSGFTGNKTASLSVPVTVARNGQKYRCVVTDANGATVTSSTAVLKVKTKITAQPKDVTAAIGDTARFTVKATGYRLTYQWQYKTVDGANWVNSTMTGSDTNSIGVISTAARNGQQYRCVITDGNGNKTYSAAATLRVGIRITAQPKDVTAAAGETVTFSVTADGLDLTYQWQYKTATGTNWVNSTAAGCDTAALSVKATAARNGQQYRCVITGAGGVETVAGPATLTVK